MGIGGVDETVDNNEMKFIRFLKKLATKEKETSNKEMKLTGTGDGQFFRDAQ